MKHFKYEVEKEHSSDWNIDTVKAFTWVDAESIEQAETIMFDRIQNDPHLLGAELVGVAD
jgi:hypothetical protein